MSMSLYIPAGQELGPRTEVALRSLLARIVDNIIDAPSKGLAVRLARKPILRPPPDVDAESRVLLGEEWTITIVKE